MPKAADNAQTSTASEMGLLALAESIDKVEGDTVTVLTRPSGATTLTMQALSGDWRVKPGQHDGEDGTDELTSADPTGSTAGTADAGKCAWPLKETREIAIAAPKKITVLGNSADAILIYYWL